MSEKKQVKTLSFRADAETLELLQELKENMSLAYGMPVTNSDIFRKALALLEIDWKWGNGPNDAYKERWKE